MWSAQGSSRVRAPAAPPGECQCDAKANSLFWLSYTEQRATQSKGRGWYYCTARSVDTLLHPIMHSTRPSIDLGKSKYRAQSLSICTGYDGCEIWKTPGDPEKLNSSFSLQSTNIIGCMNKIRD